MFLVPAKTLMIEIIKDIFNSDTASEDFRGLWVGMEYPSTVSNYPGIWVDFATATELQSAGIDNVEWLPAQSAQEGPRRVQRWRFSGTYSFTCVALSSLQRDTLLDTMIQTLAFGSSADNLDFKSKIENNDLIALTMQFDRFGLVGGSANPGTPWMTDDVVYEETISIDCEGSFLSDAQTGQFVPLSEITVTDSPQNNPADIETLIADSLALSPPQLMGLKPGQWI